MTPFRLTIDAATDGYVTYRFRARNPSTGDRTDISGATVTMTIRNSGGSTVGTVTLAEASAGVYRGALLHTVSLTRGTVYPATIVADGGAGLYRTDIGEVAVE